MTDTEPEFGSRGWVTARIESVQELRTRALHEAALTESLLPVPEHDDEFEHAPGCTMMTGASDRCDCPLPPRPVQHRWLRSVEEAKINRILRIAGIYMDYITRGMTPQAGCDEEFDTAARDLMASLGIEPGPGDAAAGTQGDGH